MDKESPAMHRRLLNAAAGHAESGWARANALTRDYLRYLFRALKSFNDSKMGEAVGFAYWALFSLFPLAVLGILAATAILGPRTAKAELYLILKQFIPDSLSTLIRDSIDQVIAHRVSFSLITFLSLAFGATRLFTELQRNLSRIFQDKRPRPWYIQIPIGALMIGVLAVLLAVSVNLSALLRTLNLELVGRRQSPILGIATALTLFLIDSAMFVMLFRFIPRRKIGLWVLLLASAVGGAACEISRGLFDWYLVNVADLGLVYGSASAVIGLLTWMFLIGGIISLCAEIAVATDNWRLSRGAAPLSEAALPEAAVAASSQPELDHDIISRADGF